MQQELLHSTPFFLILCVTLRCFITLTDMRILSSYNRISGSATMVWLIQSGEGVMIAATNRIAT